MRAGPAASGCFLPQSRIRDLWRWRWASAPSLAGIPGDWEGWLGVSKEWAASFRSFPRTLWLAAHGCFGPLRWFSSAGPPGLEQVRPGAGQSPSQACSGSGGDR